MAESKIEARLMGEFVGTFILIFTIGCNVLTGQTTWAGVSIASALTVMVYALAGCSGAHLNPAVSVALWMAKKEEKEIVKKYIPVQLLAGVLASLSYSALFWQGTPQLKPKPGYGFVQAGLAEALYTFMLCFVVLNVAASKTAAKAMQEGKNQFYGLAIGFVIVAGAYGAGNISGGCFNPAVALGLDISGISHGFGYSLVYMLFEIVGAVLSVVAFRSCRPDDKSDTAKAYEPHEYPFGVRCRSEFLGTFFLVLTVGLNVITESDAGAFSIAASLMCMIFALGNCSGGHFNPAVTTALVARGGFDKKEAPGYIFSQCAGGVAAALTYSAVTWNWSNFGLGPAEHYNAVDSFLAEMIYTFVLCFVVLSVATVENGPGDYIAFAIGSCITVGGFAIGGISGASLNPAVSLGISVAHLFGGGGVVYLVEYVLAELIGGFLASAVFRATRASLFEKDKKAAVPEKASA